MPPRFSKAELRRLVRTRTKRIEPAERARLSARVCRHILRFDAYRLAEQVLAYIALDDEVSLDAVLEEAVRDGKRIFLPLIDDGGTLVFRSWLPGSSLREGPLGVREPVGDEGPASVPSVSLVPGRAFDLAGRRLGRGKAYYDGCLQMLAVLGPTVGVGFACQVFPEVPSEPHDRRVDYVATEHGIVRAELEDDPAGVDGR